MKSKEKQVKKLYNITWINNSESEFGIELTDEEKDIIKRFLDVAEKHVVDYDMPSVYFAEKE